MGPRCLLALTEITALGLTVLPLQTFGMHIVGIDVLAILMAFQKVASATCLAGPPVLLFMVCLVLGIVLHK
jgi:hypothetical protein